MVDDYAHHPAEIRATLAAARERGPGRVIVVFQPHLPSRTRALGGELAEALGAADVAMVTDVYLAREPADPAVTGRSVAERVPPPARAAFAPTLAEAADAVMARGASRRPGADDGGRRHHRAGEGVGGPPGKTLGDGDRDPSTRPA